MAMEIAGITLGNTFGFWGLLSLIPFVIIYLIRPRPKKVEIPSLMFFLTSRDNPKQQSFFRNFAKDWLFILQLLILLFFISQLVEPLTTYEHDITSENTVLVLDVSASMQARQGSNTRFSIARSAALENLGKSNTIILAGGTPKVVLKDGTLDDAVEILNSVQVKESPSAIGESLVLAGELLGTREGRVIGISDFINTRGLETETAKTALSSKGVVVDFIDVTDGKKASNVGIIDLEIDESTITVFIRNFDEEKNTAELKVGDLSQSFEFEALETKTYSFGTPTESLSMNLIVDDDFDADNVAYLSIPNVQETKVEVITNNDSLFVKNALSSGSRIQVSVTEPPIVPTSGYDVYVITDVDPNQVLPGTFSDLSDEAKKGASVIVAGQDNLPEIKYGDLLPVDIIGLKQGVQQVVVEQDTQFTQNIDFGTVDRVIEATPKEGAISLASAGPNTSIITFKEHGDGKLVYYGIIEAASHFKLSPSYPIFWVKLMEFLIDQQKIENLNVKTGETKVLEEVQKIKTPTRSIKQNLLTFDDAGYYEYGKRKIAANLLDQAESTINQQKDLNVTFAREVKLKAVTEERELSFVIPLIIIVMILIFLELLYVKVRGDL